MRIIVSELKKLKYYKLAYRVVVAFSSSFLNKLGIIRQKASGTKEAEARRDKIIIYDKFFKYKKPVQKHILAHEIGHIFQNIHDLSILDLEKLGFFVFEYEDIKNAMEGFAEAFAVYIDKPNELKKRYPKQFELMKNMVGNPTSIKKWIKTVLIPQLEYLPYNQVFRLKDIKNIDIYKDLLRK